MIKYVFRDGPLIIKNADKASPQVIGEALAKIAEANGGDLRPKAVLEAARSSRHPLHKHFDWDDASAAEKHRLHQAREIIGIVRVSDSKEGPSPAFISISGEEGVSYRTAAEVRTSADLQAAVLRQCDRDLDAIAHRYRQLIEVCDLVGKARAAVQKRLDKIETRAAA